MPIADPTAESLAAIEGFRREIDAETSGWLLMNKGPIVNCPEQSIITATIRAVVTPASSNASDAPSGAKEVDDNDQPQ